MRILEFVTISAALTLASCGEAEEDNTPQDENKPDVNMQADPDDEVIETEGDKTEVDLDLDKGEAGFENDKVDVDLNKDNDDGKY